MLAPAIAAPPDGGDRLPARAHGLVWGALLALIVLLAVAGRAYDGRSVWAGWRESGGLRHSSYAERIYPDDLFRTRANTWSNLAFVAAGFYAFAFARHDSRRTRAATAGYLVRTPAMSVLFGAGCCWLGAGSGFFHASLTRFGQQLDVASMYGPLLALVAVSVGRRVPSLRWPWLAGVVVLASAALFYFKWSMSSAVVLSTLIGAVGIGALLDRFWPARRMAMPWLGASAIALAAGIACRQLDVAGRFTGPDAWLQGHALWHVLTAASLGCAYLYQRSESLSPAHT